MDFDTWLARVNAELAAQGKKFSTFAIDPDDLAAAFDAVKDPDEFARTATPRNPATPKRRIRIIGELGKIGPVDYGMLGFLHTALKGIAWLWWIAASGAVLLGFLVLLRSGNVDGPQYAPSTGPVSGGVIIFGGALLYAASMFIAGAISMLLAQLIPLAVSAHEKLDGKDRP